MHPWGWHESYHWSQWANRKTSYHQRFMRQQSCNSSANSCHTGISIYIYIFFLNIYWYYFVGSLCKCHQVFLMVEYHEDGNNWMIRYSCFIWQNICSWILVLPPHSQSFWAQVILACVEGSLGRKVQTPQLSAYTVQKAILAEYQENKRFPEGLTAQVPSVRDWALRCGAILKKCVRSSVFLRYETFSWPGLF